MTADPDEHSVPDDDPHGEAHDSSDHEDGADLERVSKSEPETESDVDVDAVGIRRSADPDADLALDDALSEYPEHFTSADGSLVESKAHSPRWTPRTARSVPGAEQATGDLVDTATAERAVLFVCAANICRSPLMAFTFAQAELTGPRGQAWTATSGGVHVRRTAPMCDVAFTLIADDAASQGFIASHSATPIDAEDLATHDIIIAASRDERAAIALLQPALRTRTFTLKEAVALGREPLAPGELGRATRAIAEDASLVARYAALLNARRGSLVPPGPSRLRLPWVPVVDPMDIPDAHHGKLRRHVAVLEQLQATTREFHAQIAAFIDNDGS